MVNLADLPNAATLAGTETLPMQQGAGAVKVTALNLVRQTLSLSQNFGIGAPNAGTHLIRRTASAEGSQILAVMGANHGVIFADASQATYGLSQAAIYAARNSITGRSINAGGTINASGADYAEYMRKRCDCGTILAGDICGVDENGELTDQFTLAHSFVVKSTDPAYVGNDSWGAEDVVGPRPVPPEDGEDSPSWEAYLSNLSTWTAAIEAERVKWDRIAFCGQVPVNFTEAEIGQYLVPVAASGNKIGIVAKDIEDMTLAEYTKSIGQVWKILPDGRAWVAVKVA